MGQNYNGVKIYKIVLLMELSRKIRGCKAPDLPAKIYYGANN